MVRFFIGCEPYLSDKRLADALGTVKEPEMNITTLYDGFDMEEAASVACAVPFLSERRLLVFRLTEAKGELQQILQSLPETTDAIVIAPKIDRRGKLYNKFRKNIEECGKLKEEELIGFIEASAKEEGRRIERHAAFELARRIHYYEDDGVNLYAIKGAVRQLSCIGDITLGMVEQSLPEDIAGKAYRLSRMLCLGQGGEMYGLAQYLLDCGESEIGILSLLAKTFRMAWQEKAIGRAEGPRFQYSDAMRFSETQLADIQDILSGSVAQIKKNGMGPSIFLVALAKCMQVLHGIKRN